MTLYLSVLVLLFQSTRLREARPARGCRHARSAWRFNPRACVRRDRRCGASISPSAQFQSTRLREARPMASPGVPSQLWFQSTRLREARRVRGLTRCTDDLVSIHAPA